MSAYPTFDAATVENIARILGKAGSSSDISRYLEVNHLVDDSGESTKWKRLDAIFLKIQRETRSAEQIIGFIGSYLSPKRFIRKSDKFELYRNELNEILSLEGLEYLKDGKFRHIDQAEILDELGEQGESLFEKLKSLNTHPEIFKYCESDLKQGDYFTASLESCKGLFQRIRDMSGIKKDGVKLIDAAFKGDNPFLSLNNLETETAQSEQMGLIHLLKSCAMMIRNPKAHEPKILQEEGEEKDILKEFYLISMAHGELDKCKQNRQISQSKPKSQKSASQQVVEPKALVVAQLVGQWQESCDEDRKIIEKLSGTAFKEWMVHVRKVESIENSRLKLIDGNWRWRYAPRDEQPWLPLGRFIDPDMLEKFGHVAITVLSGLDPRFEFSQDQSYAMKIFRRSSRYSKQLREGVAETLALLGARGESLVNCPNQGPQQVARQVVNTLLEKADSKHWASLNDVLPLLAEAAPDEFLDAAEQGSENMDGLSPGDFSKGKDGSISESGYITGLLRALESLAWSSEHLPRVCRILANLSAMDQGGRFANGPINSLISILLPWLPQTVTDADSRHDTVNLIIQEQSDVAWQLLMGLLPNTSFTSQYTNRPRWQNFISEDWNGLVPYVERSADYAFYASKALDLAGTNPYKLSLLLPCYFRISQKFGNFPKMYLERLKSGEVLELPEEKRFKLWDALVHKISSRGRYIDDDTWNCSEEKLNLLDEVAEKIKPESPKLLHKRLFSEFDTHLYESKEDPDKAQEALRQRRIYAVREILDDGGIEGLKEFCRFVDIPLKVGYSYASIPGREDQNKVFLTFLKSGNDKDRQFIDGYIGYSVNKYGWGWIDNMDRSGWSVKDKLRLFKVLPFVNEVWERVDAELADNASEYWKSVLGFLEPSNPKRADYAIGKLIEHDRAGMAIALLATENLWGGEYTELGLRAMESLNKRVNISFDFIRVILKNLQLDENIDEDRLAKLEIKYLSGHHGSDQVRPVTIYRHMAERPELFCDLIRSVYRSAHETDEKPERESKIHGKKLKISENYYRLLTYWDHPPGKCRDGEFDGKYLREWVTKVKRSCMESGHWEKASDHIGQVLYYAPKDKNDLWIEPVCKLLSSKDDGAKYLHGLKEKIVNSRGIYLRGDGLEEIEIAEKWESIAKHANENGFKRLGVVLLEVGQSYREVVDRHIEENSR